MAVVFDQEKYIETSKGIIKEFVLATVSNVSVILSETNIPSEEFKLTNPIVYVEYERDLDLDRRQGWNTGRGTNHKRKRLTISLQVLTQGDNDAVLQRDRIVQSLQQSVIQKETIELLSGKGIHKPDIRYVGSYRVREGLYLSRMEFFGVINFIN